MPTPSRTLLRLLWSPFSLARAAAGGSTFAAALAGAFVLSVELTLPLAAVVTSLAEPFRDFPDYYSIVIKVACILAVAPFSFLIIVGAPIAVHLARGTERRARNLAKSRIVFLSPLPALVPIVLWSLPLPLPAVAHPSFGLYGTTKPAWIASPAVAFFESTAWLSVGLLIAVLAVLNAAVAFRRLKALPLPAEQFRCQQCGYSLIGLVEPRCPECATAFDPAVLQDAGDPDESWHPRSQ